MESSKTSHWVFYFPYIKISHLNYKTETSIILELIKKQKVRSKLNLLKDVKLLLHQFIL